MNYENVAVTVSELNNYIKNKFTEDEALNNIIVKGEISNFKNHYTGHMYFSIKDEKSIIKCVMFKSYAQKLDFIPNDGMKVFVFGEVSVFERDGIYQVYVKALKEDGLGSLYKKYEELKKSLEKEGLFDSAHKMDIPKFPKIIGVLTSQTGSVIKDIINVSTRRNPNVYIRLLPVPVQGEGAAIKIAEGIKLMNENNLADVIIVARGGGSLEDLWPFNEEIVARAIFNSKLPVISAVGHETDFSISDFVADLRAPTPSAAAELAVPDINELKKSIRIYEGRLKMSLKRKVEIMKLKYSKCMASKAFREPKRKVQDNYIKIDTYIKKIENIIKSKQKEKKIQYIELVSKLDTLSPLKTLTRGYSIVEKNNKIVKSVENLRIDDIVNIKLLDGEKKAKIF